MELLHNNLKSSQVTTKMYDEYLKSDYILGYANAKELKEYLLKGLGEINIKPDDFNIRKSGDELSKDPPLEIYEYQSFFMLERKNGELTLLDGFRRLIWYNTPDHMVQVRVYKEKDLTDQQIMKILIYLNHFKFYGLGDFYDRGFSLALNVIFGLNIPKYYKTFNAYLTKKNTIRTYWTDSIPDYQENLSVKDRMLNPMFVSDMKFIEGLLGTDILLGNEMGALLYEYRLLYPNQKFDLPLIIKRITENSIIGDLHKKLGKKRDDLGAEAQKIVNQLIPLYKNIFNEMFGVASELTYAEKKDLVKKLIESMKKDKTMTKITGSTKSYIYELIFKKRIAKNEPIKFKCVIHPLEYDPYRHINNDEVAPTLEYGLLPYEIVLLKIREKVFGNKELEFGFELENGEKCDINHNYGGYNGYGKKYTGIRMPGIPSVTYDCDIFVDVTKEELEEVNKHRFDYKY